MEVEGCLILSLTKEDKYHICVLAGLRKYCILLTPHSSDHLITEPLLLDITGTAHVLTGQTITLVYEHCR